MPNKTIFFIPQGTHRIVLKTGYYMQVDELASRAYTADLGGKDSINHWHLFIEVIAILLTRTLGK